MDINKAKENLKGYLNWLKTNGFSMAENDEAIQIILSELEKKDKIINDMAEIIEECRQNDCLESNEIDLSEIAGKNRIIDYFTNKYEEGKG